MLRTNLTTIAAILATTLAGHSLIAQQQQTEPVTAEITIHADQPRNTIPPEIYGHFAEHLGRCIYEGIWVGPESKIPNTRGLRNDVLAALKELNVPVLRWPGGCFADEYHWRDGIGPREHRPRIVNTHWGMVPEDNGFGTHEFMDLCETIGCEAYICGNVGSGSPQEMMEWVEYLTSDGDSTVVRERRKNGREKPWKVKYFGVGNESWGCGGNMRPEYYADLYRRYNTFVKNYPGSRIQRIACGSNGPDFNWTDVVMRQVGANRMNGISLHWYTLPTGDWKKKGAATGFPPEQWGATIVNTLRMTELLDKHLAIMDKHDPQHRVGLVIDEWGTWYDPTPGTNPGFLEQQNTIRDAVIAGINLNLFNNRSDRISMTNIAQTINVLQAMILTDKERMLRTPTYHVFEMYKVHQGATLLPTENGPADYEIGDKKIPSVYVSASKDGEGHVNVSLVNARADRSARVTLSVSSVTPKSATGRILTAEAMDAHNTFDRPDAVKPAPFNGADVAGDRLIVTLPAKSVATLRID
jgi:alpha-N-arabinofuranosidase